MGSKNSLLSPPTAQLRDAAEAALANAPRIEPPPQRSDQLLHELQVHQIELEMQNENLRQTQLALQESHDKYVDLYDFAPVGYLTLTDTGLIADINLTGAAMLGVNRKDVLDGSFTHFIAVDQQDGWYKHFHYALRHDEQRSCELSLKRSDGKALTASLVFLRSRHGDSGDQLRLALTDITARRHVESEFNQLSMAVAQSPVSVIITDLSGKIVYVNRAFSSVSGYSAAEVLGQNPRLLHSGRTPIKSFEELWAALAAGKSWHGEFINRRKDGSEYLEVATISPVRQTDGSVTHYVAVKEDVTEFRQAMDALQRSRLAKSTAGIGIFDIDIVNERSEWDEQFREIWGVGLDERVDFDTFINGVHPDDRAAVSAALDRAFDPGGSGEYSAEYRVINRLDRRVRQVAANGRAIFAAGHAVRFVGALRDVSDQKQIEQKRQERRSQMDLLVNQQVAAHTAAAIAHELNQPLVSISAYSEAALRMLRRGLKSPDKFERALEGAVAQAQRAGKTLQELLDFLHKGSASPAPVDLNEVVGNAVAAAADSGYGGFHPVIKLEPRLKPVLANRLQLEKVVLNLLHNSVDAMRDAGIATAAITITVRTVAESKMAHVTVQDNGPGLDAATARRIFEPFFTTKSEGIGLGLSISRALVETHGGKLWADLEAKTGAAFHFTVPFAQ